MTRNKISLFTVILININVIIGSGFFIGAQVISNKGGILAPFSWIVWGLIMLPLVLVLAKLARLYPHAGGLYVYAHKALNKFWAFVSGWGYFVGTIAGNAIVIHLFGKGFCSLGFDKVLQQWHISPLMFDIILILCVPTRYYFIQWHKYM